MTPLPYHLVDVFTDVAFGGNPLAVFPDPGNISTERMQAIAKELNLSETTFVFPPERGGSARVRIFTPAAELPFAGHPTLGTAFVLARLGRLSLAEGRGSGVLELGVGPIGVTLQLPNGSPAYVEMEQLDPTFGPHADRRAAAELLSVDESRLAPNLPVQPVSCGNPFVIVPIRDLETMHALRPRQDLWNDDPLGVGSSALMAFSLETEYLNTHAHARMFAPWFGVTEDAATGSAAGPLGCYMAHHGLVQSQDGNRFRIDIEQGIEMGRSSRLRVALERRGAQLHAVRVGGGCVSMGRGEFDA
jgi:trans-2,3-dihydro-3-hydroxyanthranilate isomerase